MAHSQIKIFLLRKGTMKIGQGCVDSLSKRLIYFSNIKMQVQDDQFKRGKEIFPVKNGMDRILKFNNHNLENLSSIDVLLNVWVQKYIVGQNGNGEHCGINLCKI